MEQSSLHPAYRPDIDGLRALAVMSVIIFHAWPHLLPGGFVGVDIFFVISGFLISTLILKGIKQNNFSFREFYIRRVKRIFPALILVMSVSLDLGWFVLLPDEQKMPGKHIASLINKALFYADDSVPRARRRLHEAIM